MKLGAPRAARRPSAMSTAALDAAARAAANAVAAAEERARIAVAAAEERIRAVTAATEERTRTAIADAEERARTAAAAAEERARQANADAMQSEIRALRAEERLRVREAELAGFATMAAERLRAPLHTVAGFTEMLIEDIAPGLDAESAGHLDRIDDAACRMLGVVDDLVSYSTTSDAPLWLEPVETTMPALDVIADHLQSPADPAGPEIEIGELPAVTADPLLLRQVLDHLIGNAVRFVRPGTPARVTVGARDQGGGMWRIEVADRGIGVPAAQREQIFAPFHQAGDGYPGNGLGLAVCARIVARHGGEIGVEPRPGGGSVFWFTIAGARVSSPRRAAAQ
jgi:signal transduction histidine kinase